MTFLKNLGNSTDDKYGMRNTTDQDTETDDLVATVMDIGQVSTVHNLASN